MPRSREEERALESAAPSMRSVDEPVAVVHLHTLFDKVNINHTTLSITTTREKCIVLSLSLCVGVGVGTFLCLAMGAKTWRLV